MNPIDHVWDAVGRRVAGRQPPPQTLQELERALLEEWDRIPQLVINSIIESMPQRITIVRGEMAFLEKGSKVDLQYMATEMGFEDVLGMRVFEFEMLS
ncbi:transposable element Tcb2 transposase [Trichonephila clavipes]|nr:transposable element Tcb2 transposase [Trichonephila clavipes]